MNKNNKYKLSKFFVFKKYIKNFFYIFLYDGACEKKVFNIHWRIKSSNYELMLIREVNLGFISLMKVGYPKEYPKGVYTHYCKFNSEKKITNFIKVNLNLGKVRWSKLDNYVDYGGNYIEFYIHKIWIGYVVRTHSGYRFTVLRRKDVNLFRTFEGYRYLNIR